MLQTTALSPLFTHSASASSSTSFLSFATLRPLLLLKERAKENSAAIDRKGWRSEDHNKSGNSSSVEQDTGPWLWRGGRAKGSSLLLCRCSSRPGDAHLGQSLWNWDQQAIPSSPTTHWFSTPYHEGCPQQNVFVLLVVSIARRNRCFSRFIVASHPAVPWKSQHGGACMPETVVPAVSKTLRCILWPGPCNLAEGAKDTAVLILGTVFGLPSEVSCRK